ncbi:MAG: penicillin-binding protein 2, partial [Nitrospinae bacterium]|nr:penicillin-binding protein 2 [Nitrospinota bacterium]
LRGKITDQNGVPLVDNRPSFELTMIPEDTPDPVGALLQLNRRFAIPEQETLDVIRHTRKFLPVTLERNIPRDAVAFVEENRFSLPGVFLAVKPIRRYIHNDYATHLLGYLGAISESQFDATERGVYGPNDFVGQYGVEKTYEDILRGVKGLKRVEVDAAGRTLSTLGVIPPTSGQDLALTIDYATQKAADEAFTGDESLGAAVAIDTATGAVLALTSKPSFDPNLFAYGVSREDWNGLVSQEFHPLNNRVIQGQYPPGSTFKPFVALAALEERVITPDATVYCGGSFRFGRRSYRCWKKEGHGTMNMKQAIIQSCDVYFYTLGVKLGINTLAAYVKEMGLGAPTGIPLEGERGGLIPTTEWKLKNRKQAWIAGETVSCAIGQGFVLVTPMQMAVATAAIANGGTVLTPFVVAGKAGGEHPSRTVAIAPKNIALVAEAMRGVVYEPHGTAWRLKLEKRPYQYAGKTGTAQVIKMKQNEEWEHEKMDIRYRDHAWFIAWAPVDAPRIAVAVIAEHAGHGGDAAAPIAQKIIDAYLSGHGYPLDLPVPTPTPGPAEGVTPTPPPAPTRAPQTAALSSPPPAPASATPQETVR